MLLAVPMWFQLLAVHVRLRHVLSLHEPLGPEVLPQQASLRGDMLF